MMNRRVRHFNPANAGAIVALDSRFITGVSAGSQFSPWSGRPGTSNDASNGSAGARMSYETNVQGGQPVVRGHTGGRYFDLPSINLGSTWTVIMAFSQADAASSNRGVLAPSTTHSVNFELLQTDVISIPAYLRVTGTARNAAANRPFANGAFGITTVENGSAMACWLNGSSVTLSNTTAATCTAQVYAIGRYGSGNYSNPDVGALIMALIANRPLTRRMEHSLAFSFKVSCS